MEAATKRGLVDTIAAGFGTLNRRLFLLLLPIGLDILLWLGPKLSLKPLIDAMIAANTAGGGVATPAPFPTEINLLGLLAFLMPSVIGFNVQDSTLAAPVQPVADWGQAALWGLGFIAAGILFACLYLGVLAAQVRGESPAPGAVAGRTVLYWTQMATLLLLVIAGTAGVTLVAALFSGGNPGVMLALLSGPFLAGTFYLFYVQDALFVSRVSSVNALRYALRIVRRSFWAALGLFLVAQVIALGMGVIWTRLSSTPVGLAAAIVGNAYIATGLVAAGMVFYYDRIKLIEQEEQAS